MPFPAEGERLSKSVMQFGAGAEFGSQLSRFFHLGWTAQQRSILPLRAYYCNQCSRTHVCLANLLHGSSHFMLHIVFPRTDSLFGNNLVLVLNIGSSLTSIYGVFYVCLEVKAGSLSAFFCLICWIVSSYLGTYLGLSLTRKTRHVRTHEAHIL